MIYRGEKMEGFRMFQFGYIGLGKFLLEVGILYNWILGLYLVFMFYLKVILGVKNLRNLYN